MSTHIVIEASKEPKVETKAQPSHSTVGEQLVDGRTTVQPNSQAREVKECGEEGRDGGNVREEWMDTRRCELPVGYPALDT